MKHSEISTGKVYGDKNGWNPQKVLKMIHDEETGVDIVITGTPYPQHCPHDRPQVYTLKGFASWARTEVLPKEEV